MIGFLQPLALLGLAAAAIPPLLHLLGRRLPPVVVFPALRYLTATEREHSKRLKLRNLLLLLLRTAFIVFLVLAASRPVLRIGAGGSHPPTAVALLVDNSLSSGAVVSGVRVLDSLVAAARQLLSQTEPGDRLWLALADGVPRQVTRLEALQALDSLSPVPVYLDLGAAVRAAGRALADDPLDATQVVVFSDLQATAVTPGDPPATTVTFWDPPDPPPNRWVDSAFSEPAVWTPSGNVVATVGGSGGEASALALRVGERDLARAVGRPGDRVLLGGDITRRGWVSARIELDPDELRADDRRHIALHSIEPAAATAHDGAGPFVAEALQVLQEGGRASAGSQIMLDDRVHAGTAVIVPPADPALLGALNRNLEARGVSWRFGEAVDGEWPLTGQVGAAEGVLATRRHRLEGSGVVLARAGTEPWMVRDGDVVLVASRMIPEWTQLPVSAPFVPFLDLLLNRVSAQAVSIAAGTPGEIVQLPATANALLLPSGPQAITGDRRITAPFQAGIYFLTGATGDTVGALEVNYDVRESRLVPADERLLRARLGANTRVERGRAFERAVFRSEGQADMTTLLLLTALIAALAEFAVASTGGRRETAR